MTAVFGNLPSDFLWQVLGGIAVNLRIALLALIGGFVLEIGRASCRERV